MWIHTPCTQPAFCVVFFLEHLDSFCSAKAILVLPKPSVSAKGSAILQVQLYSIVEARVPMECTFRCYLVLAQSAALLGHLLAQHLCIHSNSMGSMG